jgi:hypothetical protein
MQYNSRGRLISRKIILKLRSVLVLESTSTNTSILHASIERDYLTSIQQAGTRKSGRREKGIKKTECGAHSVVEKQGQYQSGAGRYLVAG